MQKIYRGVKISFLKKFKLKSFYNKRDNYFKKENYLKSLEYFEKGLKIDKTDIKFL